MCIRDRKDDLEDEKSTADKLKAGVQNVTEAAMKLGEAIYKAQAEEAGDADPDVEPADGPDDDIVDADFEDLDGDKRD